MDVIASIVQHIGKTWKHLKIEKYVLPDGAILLEQKIGSIHKMLLDLFNDLKKHNIQVEIIPLIDTGWLTPTCGLRKKGRIIKMSFEKLPTGSDTLNQLINYVSILNEKYPRNGFRRFSSLTRNSRYKWVFSINLRKFLKNYFLIWTYVHMFAFI